MNEATFVEGFHDKKAVQKMKYLPLGNTGLRVSKMALGGAPFAGFYESIDAEGTSSIIKEALCSGINYIDTAPVYGLGRSEEFIGKALKGVPREAYYIATKVGRYSLNIDDGFDFSAEKTRQSVDHSLKLLGLDYVDVIQVHDFEYAETLDEILTETLPALQKIVEEGKARFIGITSYKLSLIKETLERSNVKIDTILTYSRGTLIDNELINYLPFFKDKEVGVINAAPLAQGLLTFTGPREWHPAQPQIQEAAKKATEYCKANNIDIAKLALHFSCTLKGIATQLIGVGALEVLRQNLEIMTQKPTPDDMKIAVEIRQKFFSNLSKRHWEDLDPLFGQLKEFRAKNKK